MVKSSILVLGLVGALGLGFLFSRGAFGQSKINDLPTLDEFTKQQEVDLGVSQTSIGAVGLPEGKAETQSTVKSNIVTGNLFSEQALRDLINSQNLNKTETVTQTSSGAEVTTKAIRDLEISTPKSLELFRNDTSSLIVHDSFTPIGDASVIGVQAKPISKFAVARNEPTFSATITTKTGGTRNILVSEDALKRIQSNLQNSANAMS